MLLFSLPRGACPQTGWVVTMPKAKHNDLPAMITVAVLTAIGIIVAIFNGIPFRN